MIETPMTQADAARTLRCDPETVGRLMAERLLATTVVLGVRRTTVESVNLYLATAPMPWKLADRRKALGVAE